MDNLLLLDIETQPNWDLVHKLFPCPPHPRFDEGAVALGNLKDPEKIKAKVDAARAHHEKEAFDWEKKHEEGILSKKKVLLKPTLSSVCAIGTRMGEGDNRIDIAATDITSERGMLLRLWSELNECEAVVGWNLKGFDIPYLSFRWRIHAIPVPDILRPRGRYYDSAVIDLMEVAADYQYGNNLSIKQAAVALGFPVSPEASGINFWKHDRERQERYLNWDINALYHVLQSYPEALNAITTL